MSERLFVIYEVDENGQLVTPMPFTKSAITESELKRRLETIIRFFTNDPLFSFNETTWKATLGVLHGEGENQHDLPGCEEEAGPIWKKQLQGSWEVNKALSPTPTRWEWEVWAKDVAYRITSTMYESREESIIAIQNALLSMPCIPKE